MNKKLTKKIKKTHFFFGETFPSLMCDFFLKNPFFVEKKKLSICSKTLKQKDLEKNLQKKTLKNTKNKFGKRKRLKTNLAKENLSKKKKPLNNKLNSFEKKKDSFF